MCRYPPAANGGDFSSRKEDVYEKARFMRVMQEVLFPDKAIVVTDEGETVQVKYGIQVKITFFV